MIRMMQRVFLVALFVISGFVSRLEAIICFQDEKADSIVQVISTLKGKIESDPENIELLLYLGYTYLEIEKFGDADKYFRKCIKLNDTLSEAYNGLGLAQHGKGLGAVIPVEAVKKLFRIDNYSRAEKNFKRAIRFKPEYLDPHYNLGVNYLAKGGNNNYYRS
ncbi:hypothetical protein KA005_29620, partial [bacterium]|nr:hypothetical protein [bacterium]